MGGSPAQPQRRDCPFEEAYFAAQRTLLTAALLCFNLFYELAPGTSLSVRKRSSCSRRRLRSCCACCAVLRHPGGARGSAADGCICSCCSYYYMWVLAECAVLRQRLRPRLYGARNARGGQSGAAAHHQELSAGLRLREYLAAAGHSQSRRKPNRVRADGRVPARRIPLAAQHLLLHRDADAAPSQRSRSRRSTRAPARATSTTSSSTSPARSSSISSAA